MEARGGTEIQASPAVPVSHSCVPDVGGRSDPACLSLIIGRDAISGVEESGNPMRANKYRIPPPSLCGCVGGRVRAAGADVNLRLVLLSRYGIPGLQQSRGKQ